MKYIIAGLLLIFVCWQSGCSRTLVKVKSELIEIIDPNDHILYSSYIESTLYDNVNFLMKTNKELVEGKVMDMLEFKFAKSTVTPDPNMAEALGGAVGTGIRAVGGL